MRKWTYYDVRLGIYASNGERIGHAWVYVKAASAEAAKRKALRDFSESHPGMRLEAEEVKG